MDQQDFLSLLTYGIIFSIMLYPYIAYRRRKRRAPTLTNTPILLAYYTYKSTLVPAASGKLAGLEYNSMAVLPKDGAFESCTIIHIKLPYLTNVHLLGIPKAAGGTMIDPTAYGSVMEEVVLEGDYPIYFNLYADKGKQFESRYVLDPGAMWYTVEFCQSHNWEIVKGDLYFVQESDMKYDADQTNMWQDIKTFVDKIRPAVEVANNAGEPNKLEPGKKCPVCNEELKKEDNFWLCPNEHGVLIKGSVLVEALKNGRLSMSKQKELINERPRKLICPSCGSLMLKESFKTAYAKIDRCAACEYITGLIMLT